MIKRYPCLILLLLILSLRLNGQISPGELAQVHTHLEGMSNCTKCHELGKQVSNDKCLECHTELKKRISAVKGYHVSTAVRGKSCKQCHSDHHGLTFKIIRFEETKFDHNLAGFVLSGAHARQACKNCHKPEFIADKDIRKKKFTYLGLDTRCAGCHADYHQKTLSQSCENCHGVESFKPASRFSHADTKFPLKGKHQDVDCADCHKMEIRDNKRFQVFAGIQFKSCLNCHEDPHNNQFGNQCAQCHSEASFHSIKEMSAFDHNKTRFKLEGRHKAVTCKLCHTGKMTAPLKYSLCTDCHKDYHEGQFVSNGRVTDCSACHNVEGFAGSSYSIDQHNTSAFPLSGAHLATPCNSCHKKDPKWKFRKIGLRCADCHQDIHAGHLSTKYYPDTACSRCHVPDRWNIVKFDHSVTSFKLSGSHAKQTCSICHYPVDKSTGKKTQLFSELKTACSACHKDEHNHQFEVKGETDCGRCHGFEIWKLPNFNHNQTAFKLDGKHALLSCDKCHKKITVGDVTYVNYKIPNVSCKTCH